MSSLIGQMMEIVCVYNLEEYCIQRHGPRTVMRRCRTENSYGSE